MYKYLLLFLLMIPTCSYGQSTDVNDENLLIERVLSEPSTSEIKRIYSQSKKIDLTPNQIQLHDTIELSNGNLMYIISHLVEKNKHYGAIIIPENNSQAELPILIMATGGDGMNTHFNPAEDFSHEAVRFPEFIGGGLDKDFMVLIPSFRGQMLVIGDKKYQSEGDVGDAFDGATTDALAYLNVAQQVFKQASKKRIGIYGGSRGGTVALLAAARDKRIKKVITVAAPTDMKKLYLLYPDQFKLLFFNDLLDGKISEPLAREKFIRSSPIYFVNKLPSVQLHHDINDPFVPVDFARELSNQMPPSSIRSYYYHEGIHGFWSTPEFWQRVQKFVGQLRDH